MPKANTGKFGACNWSLPSFHGFNDLRTSVGLAQRVPIQMARTPGVMAGIRELSWESGDEYV
jgi:hypothetical protein